jgi:hypothetical protein
MSKEFKYSNKEYFVVDQHGSVVVDLVDLGINQKYDGSEDTLHCILAVCDSMNLRQENISYAVPTRWVKVPNTKQNYHKATFINQQDFFWNHNEFSPVIPNGIGENELFTEIKLPEYKISGNGKFRVVCFNFKTQRCTEITGKNNPVDYFIPYRPKTVGAVNEFLKTHFKKFPLSFYTEISKGISKFEVNFEKGYGKKLFANNTEKWHDHDARFYLCKFFSLTFSSGLLGNKPLQILDKMNENLKPVPKFLKILAEKNSLMADLYELENKNFQVLKERKIKKEQEEKLLEETKGRKLYAQLTDRVKEKKSHRRFYVSLEAKEVNKKPCFMVNIASNILVLNFLLN